MSERLNTLPVVDPTVEPGLEPYWEGARAGRLVLPRCSVCRAVSWAPRPFCPDHTDSQMEWFEASGQAVVHSYTRVHKGEGAFAGSTPYILAYVELEEGPRVLTNIVETDETLEIGQRVEAIFDQRPSTGAVLRFTTKTG